MRVDKKARADRLRFVVLDGLGTPVIAESPAEAELLEAYRRISA
jgi:3-dehydroquinate synthase